MDYILELRMCQSPVTVSADLPAVAQGVVRGVRRRGEAGSLARAPTRPEGALWTTPSQSTEAHSQKALTALRLPLSAAAYSPPIPPPGIPRSLSRSPIPKRSSSEPLPPQTPLRSVTGPRTHTPLSWPLPASTQGVYPIPPSARPLPPSRHPSPGRPRVAPLDGDQGRPRPPTAGPSPAKLRAPEPPARRPPASGRTHRA